MGASVVGGSTSGGGIKSVQRGSAVGSGNVSITSVDISKSFVTVYGTASSGTVTASGGLNAGTSSWNASTTNFRGTPNTQYSVAYYFTNAGFINNAPYQLLVGQTINANNNATNFNAGSNNLVSAVVQGYLSDATTLVVSGACRWEVVEFS